MVWEEIKVFYGFVGNYIVVVRKKVDKWYIGGMIDVDIRELFIDFFFFGDGSFLMEIYVDGINVDSNV